MPLKTYTTEELLNTKFEDEYRPVNPNAPDYRLRRVEQMLKAGVPRQEIARRLGMRIGPVHGYAKKLGYGKPKTGGNNT